MAVAKYIQELLHVEEEVIINDLGTLQTHYTSADINTSTHTFSPPSKDISFNERDKISNGVLEGIIAEREGVTREEAKEQVQQFVSALKIDLGIHKKYELSQVGTFSLQYEDQLTFQQDTAHNYLLESFGLPEIFGKPIDRLADDDTKKTALPSSKEKATTKKAKLPPTRKKNKTNWGAVAAIGSLALVAIWVGLVLFVNDNLNPFKYFTSNTTDTTQIASEETVETDDFADVTVEKDVTTVPEDNTEAEEVTPAEEQGIATRLEEDIPPVENTPPPTNNNQTYVATPQPRTEDFSDLEVLVFSGKKDRYHIIIGSFADKYNALKMTRRLLDRGVRNLKVVPPFDSQNRYRVAHENFNSKEEAESRANKLKPTFGSDIWVLYY
ncbi:MAG: SPOR domain-containing protein [Thermonemataceae bacterium]